MDKLSCKNICLIIFIMALMSELLLPHEAFCLLVGEAELGYVAIDNRENNKSISAHSFTQSYSIFYNKSELLSNGRLGKYSVALGYNWLSFDSGITANSAQTENVSASKGKFIYRGEVLLNPKEVPLRLNIYSRDTNEGKFSHGYANREIPTASTAALNFSVPPDIISGVTGGQFIESGATLVVGVKNGMTNGYNEILRHFPMLMLDYRDQINKDRNALYQVDNRFSRLAFVSLNKKDNWFHYRYVTYNDYIDKNNDYEETQIQLGTVDHVLQRRWIDFSNWLSVSVDGMFTKRKQVKYLEDSEEFALNTFLTARRKNWEARTFTTFTRLNEPNRDNINYKTSIPVYANGIISPTANWSAFTKYEDSHTDKGAFFKTAIAGYNINAFRRSNFTLAHGFSVERSTTSDNSTSLIMSGNISTASSPLLWRNLALSGAYNIRSYKNTNNDLENTLVDQDLTLTGRYNLLSNLYISASQSNRFTSGTSTYITSPVSDSTINSPQYISPQGDATTGTSGYQSVSAVGVSWTPKPRLNVGLNFTEDVYVPVSSGKITNTKVDASVTYSVDKLTLSSSANYMSRTASESESTKRITSTTTANVTFTRSLDAGIRFTYLREYGNKSFLETITAEQSMNYAFKGTSGYARKLFELNEVITIDDSSGYGLSNGFPNNVKQRVYTSLLGAKYYPLRQLTVAGGARYSVTNGFENGVLNYYGSLAFNSKLLTASLDYNYGINKVNNIIEKKITANVKKRF